MTTVIYTTGRTAEIPRWKLLYFINDQEGSNYEGTSLLRAAHKNWFYKTLYYKIDAMATEKQGMGMPILKQTQPGVSQQDIAKGIEYVKNIRANEKIHMSLPPGLSIEFLDMKANSLKETKDMIDHHDRQILMAFQAQFLDLGKQAGGSYALSADQSKLFLLCLEYLAKIVQEGFNPTIRELIDLNFGVPKDNKYPILEYGAIGDVDYKNLSEAIKTLSDGKFITPTIDIEQYLLKTMKLPEADDLAEQWEERKEAQEAAMNIPTLKEVAKDAQVEEKQPAKELPAGDKKKPQKEDDTEPEQVKAVEFIQDVMEFHEQLKQVIAQKRTHADN